MGRSTDISSAFGAKSITPSDTAPIPTTRALYVGTTGDIAVRMANGVTITFNSVPAGIFQVQVDKVMATNTTASNIIALY